MDPSYGIPTTRQTQTDLNGSNARLHASLWATTAPGNQAASPICSVYWTSPPYWADVNTNVSFFYKVVEGLVPAMPVEQFLKRLPASKRQIRPTKFHDFTAENIIDRQVTLNSRPFLVPHSNTEHHKNYFFVRTTTDWNHLSDDQVKAPTLEDFKRRIATQSTIWFARAHSPSVASIPKIRSSGI